MMVTKVETETTVVHILFLYYTRFTVTRLSPKIIRVDMQVFRSNQNSMYLHLNFNIVARYVFRICINFNDGYLKI